MRKFLKSHLNKGSVVGQFAPKLEHKIKKILPPSRIGKVICSGWVARRASEIAVKDGKGEERDEAGLVAGGEYTLQLGS
jgi:hypothetical protein